MAEEEGMGEVEFEGGMKAGEREGRRVTRVGEGEG